MDSQKRKLDDKVLAQLHSTDNVVVVNTIKELYTTGDVSYIPSLIELLSKNEDENVQTATRKLLTQVKQTDAISLYINALNDNRYQNIQQQLLGICWESGLDFSDHLTLFIDFMLKGEFMVAFEAFTVIENFPDKIRVSVRDEGMQLLIESLKEVDDMRKGWIQDLIDLLPRMETN